MTTQTQPAPARDGYDDDAQQPDPRPGWYYVTAYDAERPGNQYAFLAGPYREHAYALRDCRRAADMAIDRDPWLAFAAFGTSGIHDPAGKPVPVGALNEALNIDPAELAPQPILLPPQV